MLNPQDRTLLHESLRPPSGFMLDYAVGTTYSLDLTALLSVPLAFTRHRHDGVDPDDMNPVALLEALREQAGRITIFNQAGRIHVPGRHHALYQLVEQMVVEVTPPSGSGSFHPKTWVLRYVDGDEAVRYRLLCLSRNLTYATTWDTHLSLSGELTARQNAFRRNHPLGDFLEALPGMAIHDLDENLRNRIDQLQYEIRRVDFEVPEPFESFKFHPLGVTGGEPWPFPERKSNLVVVSPFLSESTLNRFNPQRRSATLISRWDELEGQPEDIVDHWDEVMCLSPGAELDRPLDAESVEETDTVARSPAPEDLLEGLHAKLFIVDDGWDAHVFVGSANATASAFHRNVEFLVELIGKKSTCGTGVLLDQEARDTTFRDLLEPFEHTGETEPDPLDQKLDNMLDRVQKELVACEIEAIVEPIEDVAEYRVDLQPRTGEVTFPTDSVVSLRPITLATWTELRASDGGVDLPTFEISARALTAFFAVRVTVEHAGEERSCAFVSKFPLVGAPEDRDKRVLRSILRDEDRFLQFLALLLAEEDEVFNYQLSQTDWRNWGDGLGGKPGDRFPVLEQMLQVLHRNSEQLDRVHELVKDISEVDDNSKVIPPEFVRVFKPILEARQGLE